MNEQPTLDTERLTLRPFIAYDAFDVERLAGAREVADTTLNIPHPYPHGGAAEWIRLHGPAWETGPAPHSPLSGRKRVRWSARSA